MSQTSPAADAQEERKQRVVSVLRFAREVMKLRLAAAPNIAQFSKREKFEWSKLGENLPGVRAGSPEDGWLLRVDYPLLPPAPALPQALKGWLRGNPADEGWRRETGVRETLAATLPGADPAEALTAEAMAARRAELDAIADRIEAELRRRGLLGARDAQDEGTAPRLSAEAAAAAAELLEREAPAEVVAVRFDDSPERVKALAVLTAERKSGSPGELPVALEGWMKAGEPPAPMPVRLLRWADLDAKDLAEFREQQREAFPGCELPLWFSAETAELRFEGDPARPQALEAHLKAIDAWREACRQTAAVRSLYEDLWSMWSDCVDSNLRREIVFGDFLLRSAPFAVRSAAEEDAPRQAQIAYPLAARRVVFERRTAPDGLSSLEVRYDDGADAQLQREVQSALPESADFSSEAFEAFELAVDEANDLRLLGEAAKTFANRAAKDCRWSETDDPGLFERGVRFIVSPRPMLLLRDRPIGLDRALAGIADAIEEGETAIPDGLDWVVNDVPDSAPKALIPSPPIDDLGAQLEAASGEDDEILLCKSANEEQLQIAKLIERSSGVLVQGPPGTGKTHTIANLMSHLLAQGSRVLVASSKAPALTVLKEKLPADMRPLCISWLESPEKYKASMLDFADRLSAFSEAESEARIARLAEARRRLIDERGRLRKRIFANLQSEVGSIVCAGRSWPLVEAAKKLHEDEALQALIPGEIAPDVPMPIDAAQMRLLAQTRGRWSEDDAALCRAALPDPASLPDADAVARWQAALEKDEAVLEAHRSSAAVSVERDADGRAWMTIAPQGGRRIVFPLAEAEAVFDAWREDAAAFYEEAFRDPMKKRALEAGFEEVENARLGMARLSAAIEKAVEVEAACAAALEGDEVAAADPAQEASLFTDPAFIEALGWFEKEAPGGRLGFFGRLMHRGEAKQLERVRINRRPAASAEGLRKVRARVEKALAAEALERAWNEQAEACGAPAFRELGLSFADVKRRYQTAIDRAAGWAEREFRPMTEAWRAHGVKLGELIGSFEGLIASEVMAQIQGFIDAAQAAAPVWAAAVEIERIKGMKAQAAAALKPFGQALSVIRSLKAGMEAGDAQAYGEALERLRRIAVEEKPLFERRQAAYRRLDEAAPDWAKAVFALGAEGEVPDYESALKAWSWRQLERRYREVYAEDLDALEAQEQQISRRILDATVDLAAEKAWRGAYEHLTPQKLSALKRAAQAVKRVGRGKGRKAEANSREAQRHLDECRDIVPVWIMTIDMALTFFSPQTKFDVVIVDEASQAEITSVALLAMARKAVIVGDDEQVSPTLIGFDAERVSKLRGELLADVANPQAFDLDQSLYDMVRPTFK